ncbi:MAG TPA: hypothetical protein VG710_15025 [Opitutus sp.]|nr:hypothetical protein [Opitutus sp.]
MDPDRLAELQRQRAIVRDHLAWLENEIAAATGVGAPPPRDHQGGGGAPSPRERTPFLPAAGSPSESSLSLETTVGLPPSSPTVAADSARRGCIFAAIVLFLVGAIALTAIYFVRYRDHPVIFMHREAPPASRK